MKWTSTRQFGHDALGPVVNVFMLRLHAYLRQCNDADHKIIFALRAGLRIMDLYQTWLSARGVEPPANMVLFRASRMMVIKAVYSAAPEVAVTALGQELNNTPLNDIIRSILAPEIAAGRCLEPSQVQQMPVHEFLSQGDQLAQFTRRYLNHQSNLYASYLKRLVGRAERLVLVDSGWRGTTQLLLEQGFPEYEWEGVYFGCIGRREILAHRPGPMHGLVFDSDFYQPDKPETAFLVHRHLIESLFEPGIPSFEQIEPEDIGVQVTGAELVTNELRESWDDAYDGVRAYLSAHASDQLSKIETDFWAVMERLADILCYPTEDDIPYACGKARSQDLGRFGETTPVMPSRDRFDRDSPELRIKQAIWQTGQVAREYPAERALVKQKKVVASLMRNAAGQYFTAPTDDCATEAAAGRVAIITRTKDRPLLLRRAAESVARQTYNDYSWVIVNDGGSLDDVQQVLDDAVIDPSKVTICSNSESLGMEAASNVGIRSSESEYIVIHDDDDSWHPDFLKETTAFLRQNGKVYDGVITKTLYVSEEIRGQEVIEHGRWPHNDWVQNVQISEMVVDNFFAPIAFMFRRDIWEQLNGFDANLPVLGDWDFNIRFLMKSEIGVLPKVLAYYHHRDRGNNDGTYSNSVIGGQNRHAAYNAIVRNKYIRLAGTNSDYAALAVLMGTGLGQKDLRHRLDNAREQITSLNHQTPPAESADIEALQREAATVTTAAERLREELDRRWVMLHMVASEIVRAGNLDELVPELLARFAKNVDEYAASAPLDPPPDFNEEEYMEHYGDVAEAAATGHVKSGFDHYIKHGAAEGRLRATQDS